MRRCESTSWVDVASVGTRHNRPQIAGRSSEPCLAYLTRVNVEMLELATLGMYAAMQSQG